MLSSFRLREASCNEAIASRMVRRCGRSLDRLLRHTANRAVLTVPRMAALAGDFLTALFAISPPVDSATKVSVVMR
jgi:hypothetical protein